jgi:hypothetical protein
MSFAGQYNNVAFGLAEVSILGSAIVGFAVQQENAIEARFGALDAEGYSPSRALPVIDQSKNPKVANGGYRPAEWDNPNLVYAQTSIAGYFFDAILRADHVSTLGITEHPVQTGASISDHSYQLPARLTLDIAMSDVMASHVLSDFGTVGSKSVSAYQILQGIQSARLPISITTRLKQYDNMLLETLNAPDDVKTRDGLRCTASFKQILMADVVEVVVSARTQANGSGSASTKRALPVKIDTSSGLVKLGAPST